MLHIGSILDRRYRIDYVVKQGGMGTVYGAHDLRLDRPCAVKAVPAQSLQEIAQIEREARVLAGLCHPHLPAIYDCLEAQGVVFVIMQMIPGEDLEAATLRGGPPRWERLIEWALQLAEVVQYLHEQAPPVIHRDIKPANIRLAPHGQIYLVDFGIAKLLDGGVTATAARAASVPYAPIEQIQEGSHTDQQSDIYAFGATLYRLLSSTLPPSCIDRLVGKDLLPLREIDPTIPAALDALIHRCMEIWSADRPATMGEVLQALHAIRAQQVDVAPSVSAAAQPQAAAEVRTAETGAPATNGQARQAFEAGEAALERGDNAAARRHFSYAIENDHRCAEAYAGRARALAGLKHYEAALEDWNAALAQQPDNAQWYRRRAHIQRQRSALAAAFADLSTAIDLQPELADLYFERAMLRSEMDDSRGQMVDLDRAIRLADNHRPARLARARARMDQQLWQAAILDCDALIQSNPRDVTAYLLRAHIYARSNDTARALRDIAAALALDAHCAEAYYLRGRLLQRSGDRQAALRDFDLAISNAPDHVEARHRRAQLYRALGAEREALDEYRTLGSLLRSRASHRNGADDAQATTEQLARTVAVELQFVMQSRGLESARRFLHSRCASFREDSDTDLEQRAALFERVGQIDAALDDLERAVKILKGRQRIAA
jgi:serine/threonine-protein kinase